jgi:two-component system response regulator VanR
MIMIHTAQAKILLVEDEVAIRKALGRLLEANGYLVKAARNGEEALLLHREYRADLILLDIMMSGMNGYTVCKRIRETDTDTPIIFLTALNSEENELEALEVGADSYIAKTVSDDILLGRIAAVIRRRRHENPKGDFSFNTWRIFPLEYVMSKADGAKVALTEREISALRIFAAHPDEVISRDYLYRLLWGNDADIGENALTVMMARLRDKLGSDGNCLKSIRGIGYAYRAGNITHASSAGKAPHHECHRTR